VSYLVNLVLEGRRALVVGGGEVALRKVGDLLAAKAAVSVVAIEACAGMRSLIESGRVTGWLRAYRKTDLDGAFLVVAATNDKGVNEWIHQDALALGVLVNVVDDPPLCTFTVPATVHRGLLTVAVATDGNCPALAGILREELDAKYGLEYVDLLNLMGALRRQMIARRWDGARIRDAVRALYHGGVVEALAAHDLERVRTIVRSHLDADFQM
jgi:precorrin-2 dehydrogenase/sirohydrochlorin ferrochelatase